MKSYNKPITFVNQPNGNKIMEILADIWGREHGVEVTIMRKEAEIS